MKINDILKEQSMTEDLDGSHEYRGLVMSVVEGEDGFKLTAHSPAGKKLGFVEFSYDTDGMIWAEELEVDERYRGQGIARTMYDYAKSLGFTIRRSNEQTPDGAAFWDKNKPGKKIWEQGVAEGFLNEASSDEAWELVGQPVPEIQQFVKQMGYGNDEQSVAKITSIIDRASSTQIPAASIPKLKNLANKGNDAQTLKAIQQISGRPDAEQQYTKLMQARDAGEGRQRDVSGYLQYVKSGNYDPPVLLKLPTGVYVIGGRTRLYAALALGVPANVKIISANSFKKGVAEGLDSLDPFYRQVLLRMKGMPNPGSWLSAEHAYAIQSAMRKKSHDRRAWETEIQMILDLYNQHMG